MNTKFKRNMSWIFFGNIVHAIFQYLLNIYIARVFTTNDYGLINYATSLIAFFTSIGTLGFNGVITKKFSDDERKAGEYIGSAIVARQFFAVVAIVVLQIIVRGATGVDAILPQIVFYQSLAMLFGPFDMVVYWYRYKYAAHKVAITRLFAFFISAGWRIVAVAVFKNISAYVLGVTLESVLFGVFLAVEYKKEYPQNKLSFSGKTVKGLLLISYPFISSALLSTIYGQTDKIMLKAMMSNEAVAMYSVAMTLAGAISIIPQALIEGFRPDIMKFRQDNMHMYRRRLKQLYACVFWICVMYCVGVTIFAKWIVLFLYGEKYLAAVPSLSLIVWYTTFSYFGAINNIYMVAENKSKWVQVTTLVGAITNVVLNALLIPGLGVVGAAMASLVTQIIANFALLYFIKPIRENFYLILQAVRFNFD